MTLLSVVRSSRHLLTVSHLYLLFSGRISSVHQGTFALCSMSLTYFKSSLSDFQDKHNPFIKGFWYHVWCHLLTVAVCHLYLFFFQDNHNLFIKALLHHVQCHLLMTHYVYLLFSGRISSVHRGTFATRQTLFLHVVQSPSSQKKIL